MATQPFYTIENGQPVLNVGACRHSVTIQAQGPSSPPVYDAGGVKNTWNAFLTGAMAGIMAVRGTDVIKGGQTTTQLFLTVVLWFQPGVTPNMRVVTDPGSTYLIQSVENVLEMDVVLVLNCIGLGANE